MEPLELEARTAEVRYLQATVLELRGAVQELEATNHELQASVVELTDAVAATEVLVQQHEAAAAEAAGRRGPGLRSLLHFVSWLLPPTRRKLRLLAAYLRLRQSGEFDADFACF